MTNIAAVPSPTLPPQMSAELARATQPTDAVEYSVISWSAILAGGLAAATLSLTLVALGVALGFPTLAPWGAHAPSPTFKLGTGLYLLVIAIISSSVGGYLAGRLRHRWEGSHQREVFFRDTAHGFLTWCFATLVGAAILGSAAGTLASGTASLIAAPGVLDRYVDTLARGSASQSKEQLSRAGNAGFSRTEIAGVFAAAFAKGGEFSADDRAYLIEAVVARSGASQSDAEQRVTSTIAEARTTVENVGKSARQLSLWLTASLFLGAFSASLAAIEGGGLRDGTWKYQV